MKPFLHTVTLRGVTLDILYYANPAEIRNQGHPDHRLPDVTAELDIAAVSVRDFDPTEVAELIKEDKTNDTQDADS